MAWGQGKDWRQVGDNAVITEFGRYTGDCMWHALLACMHASPDVRTPMTYAELDALTAKAIAAKLAGERGQSSLGQVVTGAKSFFHVTPALQLGYQVGLPVRDDPDRKVTGWLDTLQRYAGIFPILLMIENASGLYDNERGVARHGIAILGADPMTAAYMADNGDSSKAKQGKMSYYRFEDLLAAQPSGLLVFARSLTLPAPSPSPSPSPSPDPRKAQAVALLKQAEVLLA